MKFHWNHDDYHGKRDGINTWKIIPIIYFGGGKHSYTGFSFEWLGLLIHTDKAWEFKDKKRKHYLENGLGEDGELNFSSHPVHFNIGCMVVKNFKSENSGRAIGNKLLIHFDFSFIFIYGWKTFTLPWKKG